MINNNENNKIFAHLVTEIIDNKYDIQATYSITERDDNWSNLSIIFNTNLHDCLVTVSINYKIQVIDKLVEDISIRIDKQILNSYLK